jgi:hypothetical protein
VNGEVRSPGTDLPLGLDVPVFRRWIVHGFPQSRNRLEGIDTNGAGLLRAAQSEMACFAAVVAQTQAAASFLLFSREWPERDKSYRVDLHGDGARGRGVQVSGGAW